MKRPWPVAALAACLTASEPEVTGPARCERPAAVPGATGCALLFGSVTDGGGVPLDGIEGSIRPGTSCPCPTVTLQVDDRGLFSATVYRTAGTPDTATVTIVVQATAPRYPRHVTGAPYFDTAAVTLRFASTGAAPEPREVRLRIPLP